MCDKYKTVPKIFLGRNEKRIINKKVHQIFDINVGMKQNLWNLGNVIKCRKEFFYRENFFFVGLYF